MTIYDRILFSLIVFLVIASLICAVIIGHLWPIKLYFIYRMVMFARDFYSDMTKKEEE